MAVLYSSSGPGWHSSSTNGAGVNTKTYQWPPDGPGGALDVAPGGSFAVMYTVTETAVSPTINAGWGSAVGSITGGGYTARFYERDTPYVSPGGEVDETVVYPSGANPREMWGWHVYSDAAPAVPQLVASGFSADETLGTPAEAGQLVVAVPFGNFNSFTASGTWSEDSTSAIDAAASGQTWATVAGTTSAVPLTLSGGAATLYGMAWWIFEESAALWSVGYVGWRS